MTNNYLARRSFYSGGKMIKKGDPVQENDPARLQELSKRRLIVKVVEDAAAPGPSETKVIQPAETKQTAQDPAPVQVQAVEDPAPVQEQDAEDPENDTPPETPLKGPQDVLYDLTALSTRELKEEAKRLKIKGYSSMNKDELIQAIKKQSKGDE